MRVLQTVGSTLDDWMFRVSWFWAKNCPSNILRHYGVQFDYLILVPPAVENDIGESPEKEKEKYCYSKDHCEGVAETKTLWYFVEGRSLNKATVFPLEEINEQHFLYTLADNSRIATRQRYPSLPKNIQGPMTIGEAFSLIEQKEYDIHLPQCFDFQGMTTLRMTFENLLQIPNPGPTGMTNVLSQNKTLTRSILQNIAGVNIPKGEVLYKRKIKNQSKPNQGALNGHWREDEEFDHPTLPLPFIIKPAAEDNSRGVSLCEEERDVKAALELAFKYGDCVIVEEFIPGREIRAACVEDSEGTLRVLSCKLEYVLKNRIRRTEDKLAENGDENDGKHIELATYDKEFLIPGLETQKVPKMPEATLEKVDRAVLKSHEALGGRDFSLFDFRIHEKTGEPYILESCSFWEFTSLSVISGLLDRSKEFFSSDAEMEDPNIQPGCWKKVAADIWQRVAQRQV